MKRILVSIVSLVVVSFAALAQPHFLSDWTMHREGDSHSYQVKVPCTVAGALNEAGAFGENVLEQDRYFQIDRTQFDSPWVFTTKFDAPKGLHHILCFEGLG